MMKRFVFILVLFFPSVALSQEYIRYTTAIDTPTAFTIAQRTFHISFLGYDQGGVELKTFIGIHDAIFLGISEDIEHSIGKQSPKPNTPGVVAKIRFTDGWETFPISIAAGYDSFYFGSVGKVENNANKLNRIQYGPYIVVTKPIFLFNDEQYFSFGIRVPTQPEFDAKNTSYFASLCVPLGSLFTFKFELERVYYNLSRSNDWLCNFGARFNMLSKVGLEFNVIKQRGENLNRIIKVEYSNVF